MLIIVSSTLHLYAIWSETWFVFRNVSTVSHCKIQIYEWTKMLGMLTSDYFYMSPQHSNTRGIDGTSSTFLVQFDTFYFRQTFLFSTTADEV